MSRIRTIREKTGKAWNALRGVVRRVIVTRTALAGIWQAEGFVDDEDNRETFETEAFSWVGFYARPLASATTVEAILVHVGAESGHPAIVACRDLRTMPALEPGEACLFKPDDGTVLIKITAAGAIAIRCKPGSTVSIDDGSGTAVALATKADVEAVRAALDGHAHTYLPGPGPVALTTLNPSVPSPSGTSVLRGK
jgi:phage gp45-like